MASRRQVYRLIYRAVHDLVDSRTVQGAVADVILTNWHTSFIAKAHGGLDEFGNEWDDIQESTKARKRGKDYSREWGTRQQQFVRQLVASGMSREEAQAKASRLAWQSLEDVPINIETGRLEESLSPEGSEDQVRELGTEMALGVDLEYAKYVNRRRRFKPTKEEAKVWVGRAARLMRNMLSTKVEQSVGARRKAG